MPEEQYRHAFGVGGIHKSEITWAAQIRDRLVTCPAHPRELPGNIRLADKDRVMFGPERRSVLSRNLTFVMMVLALVANGEGMDVAHRMGTSQGGHRTRINTAGESDTNRHVRSDGQPADFSKDFNQDVARIAVNLRRVQRRPPSAFPHHPRVKGYFDAGAGGELSHTGNWRVRFGHIAPEKVIADGYIIENERRDARTDQSLEFAGEHYPIASFNKVQRLFAESVPRDENATFLEVEQSEREHSTQLLKAVRTELLVEMKDHLAVARGRETMTPLLKFPSALHKVVDLAIGDQRHGSTFIPQRLHTAGRIDDRQALHPDRHLIGEDATPPIGAPMRQALSQRR